MSNVRVPYKIHPLPQESPLYSLSTTSVWVPMLNVSLVYNHSETKRFEALVDSGAASCLFHSSIGRAMGMNVESGKEADLRGVLAKRKEKQYFHNVKIKWMGHIIPIYAGFSDHLSALAVLGRNGFFDSFSIQFDPCENPAGMLIERVYRA